MPASDAPSPSTDLPAGTPLTADALAFDDRRPLCTTPDGAVLHCACCDRVQVTFDDTAMLLGLADFRRLRATVRAACDQMEGREAGWWRLTATTDAGEVSDVFRRRELRRLHALLDAAAAMLELKTLVCEVRRSSAR